MGYAGNIGFNVRMGSTKISDHEMVGRRMLYSKQGYAPLTDTTNNVIDRKHRRIRNSRSGCLAMIYISLDRSTRLWRVVNFIEDHNHPLVTPSKRRYLPVNRVITPLSRTLFQSLNTSNISPNDQYCVAAQEAGGFDHMQYTPSDLSNMRRDDRCNIIQRDADLLIELFEERRNKSSDFFFSFTRHDNGHLSNLFWADPGCRHDYDLFGDSITFDTTYKTNKYNLIFDAVSIGSFEVSGTIDIGDEGVYAKCTCRLFESFGIPCRHIICYITLNTISILPETLVCNHWRAIQRKRPTTSSHTTDLNDTGNLRPLFNHLISLAGESKAKIIYARKILEDGIKSITDNQTGSDIAKVHGSITRFHDSNTQSIDIGNPEVARTKGCGNGGRPSKKSERFISKRMINMPIKTKIVLYLWNKGT
ncbi:hypothetical protein ZOSMA_7G01710 [Zostera marina]|uniref:SWIM-type domain-containing protein n=1 Tax=Zostera marina TaxID=29655 RepID=A0A0K9NQB5_ZOSMR|nr:hypothetical protein ZOSMA_7G01710 [Zostera marina]